MYVLYKEFQVVFLFFFFFFVKVYLLSNSIYHINSKYSDTLSDMFLFTGNLKHDSPYGIPCECQELIYW